jgi:hypothetical protein
MNDARACPSDTRVTPQRRRAQRAVAQHRRNAAMPQPTRVVTAPTNGLLRPSPVLERETSHGSTGQQPSAVMGRLRRAAAKAGKIAGKIRKWSHFELPGPSRPSAILVAIGTLVRPYL